MKESSCQVVRTLDIVGEKWSLLIIRNALRGQTKYSEFRDNLGAPTDILTNRLGKLVDAGILERRSYRDPGDRERSSYNLTPRGEGLRLVIAAMVQWGDEFNPSPLGPSSKLIDTDGEGVELAYVDRSGDVITPERVLIAPGPAATVQWAPVGVAARG